MTVTKQGRRFIGAKETLRENTHYLALSKLRQNKDNILVEAEGSVGVRGRRTHASLPRSGMDISPHELRAKLKELVHRRRCQQALAA